MVELNLLDDQSISFELSLRFLGNIILEYEAAILIFYIDLCNLSIKVGACSSTAVRRANEGLGERQKTVDGVETFNRWRSQDEFILQLPT